MSVNGRGSANLHHVTVKAFAEATGISERQAKYFRKGWVNPVTRVMLAGGHVKPYQAARLVDEWDLGSLALISIHVMDSRMGAQGRRACHPPGLQRGTATASRH